MSFFPCQVLLNAVPNVKFKGSFSFQSLTNAAQSGNYDLKCHYFESSVPENDRQEDTNVYVVIKRRKTSLFTISCKQRHLNQSVASKASSLKLLRRAH